MLIFADVANLYCLWSLHRMTTSSNVCLSRQETNEKTLSKTNVQCVQNWGQNKSEKECQGTALFIAATLLVEGAVEIMVPMQAGWVSILYYMMLGIKRGDFWVERCGGLYSTLMYTGSICVWRCLYFRARVCAETRFPELNAWKRKVIDSRSFLSIFALCLQVVWFCIQSTYAVGTLHFDSMDSMSRKDTTWIGGFD